MGDKRWVRGILVQCVDTRFMGDQRKDITQHDNIMKSDSTALSPLGYKSVQRSVYRAHARCSAVVSWVPKRLPAPHLSSGCLSSVMGL